MEDFEYSLEISDRDWECFFAECEECNQLPPSLARVDDSGMTDFDDPFLAQRARRVDPTPDSLGNDHPVDCLPECGGSPLVKRCFGKHESSGFDSILSGSEEDLHLQSVNIFFERLKGLREAEPGPDRVGNNKETKQVEQPVSERALSKSCPKVNMLPDRVEKTFDKMTERPVDPIWNINTRKIVTAESNFSSEPETCSISPLNFCKSPETELFITEEDFTDSAVDEAAQCNRLHDSTESVVGKSALPGRLPDVKESEETLVDSSVLTEEDEPKLEKAAEEMCEVVSSSSRTVNWQSEPVLISQSPDICPERTVLESVTDSSQPVLTERAQTCLKTISKTVSVHNLQALDSESFSYMCKRDAFHILEEQETRNMSSLTGTSAAKKDTTLPSSSTNTYRISFTDIFQYFFGEKQSVSSQSAREDTSTFSTNGNSVPETYDHFFSEFDNESFFYPLFTAAEKNKDKPVPIFSYSRSTSRNFQFPEAYEHFFASSSSDDSSDEEENCRPVKVVSRFSRKVSSPQITTDVYEDFFTDGDITRNLFSLSSLSFRKISFTAPAVQDEERNSLVPLKQSSRHRVQKIGFPVNALGDPDVMFPDPLLYHLEERISTQLTLLPCRYEGLEVAVSNPSKLSCLQ
ncbi:hypothetical protein GOODEAATRI_017581 [Goodea atripinnis]|uniref:Uncharacterized protein n=1 Tax=Goodea atripinnis TaxID=208336 RepID=A0ABV0PEV7_9TELE